MRVSLLLPGMNGDVGVSASTPSKAASTRPILRKSSSSTPSSEASGLYAASEAEREETGTQTIRSESQPTGTA